MIVVLWSRVAGVRLPCLSPAEGPCFPLSRSRRVAGACGANITRSFRKVQCLGVLNFVARENLHLIFICQLTSGNQNFKNMTMDENGKWSNSDGQIIYKQTVCTMIDGENSGMFHCQVRLPAFLTCQASLRRWLPGWQANGHQVHHLMWFRWLSYREAHGISIFFGTKMHKTHQELTSYMGNTSFCSWLKDV